MGYKSREEKMKKTLLLIVAMFATCLGFAQDIIITRDAQRIEAQITEVSSSEIKYKEKANPNGPTFVLSTSEINSIIYASGTVKVYDQQPVQQQPMMQQPMMQQPAANTYNNTPSYNNYGTQQAGNLPFIEKRDDGYLLGGQRISEDQYFDYIRNNCREAWESYQNGCKLWKCGWAFFGVGTAMTVTGAALIASSVKTTTESGRYYSYTTKHIDESLYIPGAVLTGVGCGFEAAAIPCIIVGGIRKYNSHKVYNQSCSVKKEYAVTFGIQPAPGGMGLAMNF